MDDVAHATSHEDPDLAAIVLGRTQAGDRRIDAPEQVPAWIDHAPARGYDARSVAVLALVVAVLAAVLGWATNIADRASEPDDVPAVTTPNASPDDAFGDALGSATTAVAASAKRASTTPAVRGVDLVPGRIVVSKSGSGSGLVTVAVRNVGSTDLRSANATVLVLLDGEVVGTHAIGSLAAGESTRLEFPIGWCPADASALVALVDAGAAVREADERNNALTQSARFGC